MPSSEQSTTASGATGTELPPVFVIAHDYHRSAEAALYAYAQVVADTPDNTWGTTGPDARAVAEADAIAWNKAIVVLDASDKSALEAAIAAIVTDTAVRVLGVAEMRNEIVMILRGLAQSHRFARDTCLHDHYHAIGEPCPRSAP